MPIYINRTNAGKNQMPRARVDLSDDEQCVRNMLCYIQCVRVYYNIWSDELSSRRSTEVTPSPRGLGANVW